MLSAKPSVAIFKFWQGIVEMVLRIAIMVIGFALYISAIVSSSFSVGFAVWMLLTILIMLMYEAFAIAARFFNLSFINAFSTVFFCVDAGVHVFLAVSMLIGGAVTASYAAKSLLPFITISVTKSPFIATSLFSFLLLPVLIFLAVWMGVYVFKKWNHILVEILAMSEQDDSPPLTASAPCQQEF